MEKQSFLLHLYVGNNGVTEEQREDVREMLTAHFKGYTETGGHGGWHDGERMHKEQAVKWEVVFDSVTTERANRLASLVANNARLYTHQQAVLWTLTPVISGISEAQP